VGTADYPADYSQGYAPGTAYGNDGYASGGYAAVDTSGAWSTAAPGYFGHDAPSGHPDGSGYFEHSGYSGYSAGQSHDATGAGNAGYAQDTSGGWDAYGRQVGTDGYSDQGTWNGYDTSGAYGTATASAYGNADVYADGWSHGPESGGYTAYGAQQTQTWAPAEPIVMEAPAQAPYIDSWDTSSNTEMWYAASDTAAWQADTWFAPTPTIARDDADMWSGGNRGSTDLFHDGSTPAPVEPARTFDDFDAFDDHVQSLPARTDTDTDPDADDADTDGQAPSTGPGAARTGKGDGTRTDGPGRADTTDKVRTKRKRSLPLTAGAPLAVMGAAAMAVAAVGGLHTAGAETKDSDTPVASGEDLPLLSPMDRQLVDLQDGAEEFAERAGRAQTRISLQERQEEAKRAAEADRKHRESLRPKYVLPVEQTGLSAYYGSTGSRWSSTHTGIDFPVDLNTPVRAITDGVVRTEQDRFYGNMVIVTAKDGTETWYCHLTRSKIRSGPVKAGDVIAYSGNTGNSTGPHLHLEVRPDGAAPINPLTWLREKGLDPT